MTTDTLPGADAGLVATDIAFAYGPLIVLDGVSITLPGARLSCLVGPSGCGKSTLLALLGNLLAPTRGTIVHAFRRPAFVFQDPCLLPWRNAVDNIAFGLKAQSIPRRERRERAEALLETVGLAPADARKFPHQLSGGMRQRIALARALVVEPDFLLFDEPFNALDADLRRQMQDLVRRLIEERRLTALMVTHDRIEAVRLADRLFVMSAAPARIVAEHDIKRAFTERDDAFIQTQLAWLQDAAKRQ